jgi:hypothetical protein
MKRTQYLTLAVAFAVVPAIGCHRNKPENEPGGAQTSTTRGGEVVSDTSAGGQTGAGQSGQTGTGTGTGAPTDKVTAKGDTLSGGQRNPAGVSGADTTGMKRDTTAGGTGGGAGEISSDTTAGKGGNPYSGPVTAKGDTLSGGQRNPAGKSGVDSTSASGGFSPDTSKTGAARDTTKPPR